MRRSIIGVSVPDMWSGDAPRSFQKKSQRSLGICTWLVVGDAKSPRAYAIVMSAVLMRACYLCDLLQRCRPVGHVLGSSGHVGRWTTKRERVILAVLNGSFFVHFPNCVSNESVLQ